MSVRHFLVSLFFLISLSEVTTFWGLYFLAVLVVSNGFAWSPQFVVTLS